MLDGAFTKGHHSLLFPFSFPDVEHFVFYVYMVDFKVQELIQPDGGRI